jgi:hypothetical protein
MDVKFNDFDCRVVKRKYENGRLALMLIDAKDGSPVATATVNIPDVKLGKNEVLIKDYSENQGMLQVLEEAGIVRATGERIRSGFVEIPICDYTGD